MTSENFTYWLQGFFEISKSEELTKSQIQEIKNHLALVFDKRTPVTLNDLAKDFSKSDPNRNPPKPLYPSWEGYMPHASC